MKPSGWPVSASRLSARIEKDLGRNHVADGPTRFAVKRLDLNVAGLDGISFDDSITPETAVVGSFHIDGQRRFAKVLSVHFDFRAGGL